MRTLLFVLQVLLLPLGDLWAQDWVSIPVGDPAERGLVAGHEPDGSATYIIRSPFQGGLTLGKYIPRSKAAYVPWGGKENRVTAIELYVGGGTWQPMNADDRPPSDAIAGGKEADGSPLYIIRAPHAGAVVPGKYSAGTGKGYIPWGGKEIELSSWEILVAASDWVASDTLSGTKNAAPAGLSPDGTPSYLIRSSFQGDLIPGKFNPKAKAAYVPWGGKENPVKTFELYMGPQTWAPMRAGDPVPQGAIIAGNQAGTPLYAIRAVSGKAIVPGKYSVQTLAATFSISGKEVAAERFEILVRPGAGVPPPTPNANPANGDSPRSRDDLARAVRQNDPRLTVVPLPLDSGKVSMTGELTAQDYQWQGRPVDAYRFFLRQGDYAMIRISSPTAHPQDFEVFVLDSSGIEVGSADASPDVRFAMVEAEHDGDYSLLIAPQTPQGRAVYGIDVRLEAFSIEGDLMGTGSAAESRVAVNWDPYYQWTVSIEATFVPQFDLLDGKGKVFARSVPDDQSDYRARVSAVPAGRGPGSVLVSTAFSNGTAHWKLIFRLIPAGGM